MCKNENKEIPNKNKKISTFTKKIHINIASNCKMLRNFMLLLGVLSFPQNSSEQQLQFPNQHNFQNTPLFNQFQQATGSRISQKQLQHIVFEEIGEMAPQMMYVHVFIPLNITTLYQQADIYKTYLLQLANSTTTDYNRIPFTKAARDTGLYGLSKINRIIQKLKNLDLNLPHVDSRQKREAQALQKDLVKQYQETISVLEYLELKESSNSTSIEDHYIHNRDKRYVMAALSLASDIVGTFMGAFNAYEIQQLKTKLQDLGEGHNSLVQVTRTHNEQINDIHRTMKQIIEIVHLMAEYNPTKLMQEIDEQIAKFEDRVTQITNAIQQLHHRRLAVDLLTPKQMEILHSEVESVAIQEGFHNQAQHISDYFQIEATYMRTGEDIIIMLHVPCIKNDLLKIYRYLPFPIPLPFTPKSHDLTIRQSLTLQTLHFSQHDLDSIFDQNNLDFPQYPEALFIEDKADLIAIGADKSFQILSQMDLANCVQRNHVYLCDRNTVVKTDLTESCLGSLYLRQEEGVRKHCKFVRRPVQEIVYQLTDTEHLIYSPILQTTTILCRNNTQETVYLEQSSRVKVPQGCSLQINKHKIHSVRQTNINPHPLHVAWTWDPLSLPSTLLSDPEHLDHLLYQLQTDFSKIDTKFQNFRNTTSNTNYFDNMLVKFTTSYSYISILIWTSLCLAAVANFLYFCTLLYYFLSRRQPINYEVQPAQNPHQNQCAITF